MFKIYIHIVHDADTVEKKVTVELIEPINMHRGLLEENPSLLRSPAIIQMPRSPRKKKPAKERGLQWAHVSPEEASGQKISLPARRRATAVHLRNLKLTEGQRADIESLYKTPDQLTSHEYEEDKTDDQVAAGALLAAVRLELDTRDSVVKRWIRRWSMKAGKGDGQTERVLYQW